MVRVGGSEGSLQQLKACIEDRERCAQLVGSIGDELPLSAKRLLQRPHGATSDKQRQHSGEDDGGSTEDDAADHDIEPLDIDDCLVMQRVEKVGKPDLSEHDRERGDQNCDHERRDGDADRERHSAGRRTDEESIRIERSSGASHISPSRYPRPRTVCTMLGSVLRRR